jgi:anaerobic magnesium-protoporphyrin IX monomethyl ester cyclase
MNIALVSLYDVENNAVRIISAYARSRGHRALEVYFKDWKNNGLAWPTEAELSALERTLRDFGATVVGFSLRASAYLGVCTFLVGEVRRRLGVPIVIGGVHATLCPETVVDLADYVIRGEAEEPVADLLDRLEAGRSATDIPNVWARLGGEVHRNEVRPLIQDLERVSKMEHLHPDKAVIEGGRVTTSDPLLWDPTYLIMASRGCPYHCSFCHNSTLRRLYRGKGRYWRLRPVDDVMEDLRAAKRNFKWLRRIRFDDEVFPQDEAWQRELLPRYKREIGLPFECFLEPRAVSPERVRRMAEAGLDVVYMGIQANDRVATELYDRTASNSGILETARMYQGLGIDTRVQVMVDDPMTTEQDRRDLFELLNSIPRPFRVYLFSMTVMPGTELERKLLEEKVIRPEEVEGVATKTFSQYRVSLDWDRPPDEMFWISMYVLVNKRWIPASLLDRASHSPWLRRHPRLLARAASLSNLVSMAGIVPYSVARGEVGPRVLRRFWNPGHWITA